MRPEEQKIPVGYLRTLNELYEGWFGRYQRSPTVVLDTNELDYLSDLVHRIDVMKTIERHLR